MTGGDGVGGTICIAVSLRDSSLYRLPNGSSLSTSASPSLSSILAEPDPVKCMLGKDEWLADAELRSSRSMLNGSKGESIRARRFFLCLPTLFGTDVRPSAVEFDVGELDAEFPPASSAPDSEPDDAGVEDGSASSTQVV